MSNDDLFEDNDVVLDDETKLEEETEKREAGFSLDSALREMVERLAEKLNNVNGFSFSMYSEIYSSFMNVPRLSMPALFDDDSVTVIASYKVTLGDKESNDIYVIRYLVDLQRRIMIAGLAYSFAYNLLQILNDNVEGELDDSFLVYCRGNLDKEIKNLDFYLAQLLGMYEDYCRIHNIDPDPNLIEHQLKTYVDQVERTTYGDLLFASHIVGIGDVVDFVERRDKVMIEVCKAAFHFINKIQSAIDTVKTEKEKLLA